MQRPDKPILDKRIFWDVKFEELDYEKYANFIIERVFERGDVDDIRQVRRFYGDERVKEALTNARWLSPSTITLAMAMFNNKFEDYRCYILAQSNPTHFSY
ncbi:MAG: hypothetical protein KDC13_09125 [Bacteroidetes bacterium]|nr:hypothetical protein [Bacteroidota bacterium]